MKQRPQHQFSIKLLVSSQAHSHLVLVGVFIVISVPAPVNHRHPRVFNYLKGIDNYFIQSHNAVDAGDAQDVQISRAKHE